MLEALDQFTFQRSVLGQLTFESYLNFYMLVLRYSRMAFLMNDDRAARPNRLAVLRDIHYQNRASVYRNHIQ